MKEGGRSGILLSSYAWLIYLFLYAPILVLVVFSFNTSRLNAVWHGFTLDWYAKLAHDRPILEAAQNTFIVAIISTVASTILGTATALGMHRFHFRFKRVMEAALYVPIVIPEIVMGVSLLSFFVIAGMGLGLGTVIISHITFSVSFVVVTVRARLHGFNMAYEEAAMDLGATPWQTFTMVTLPIIMPGIISGALLAFTLSLDDFVITYFTVGPDATTLPIRIYSMVKFMITPEINALTAILLIATLALITFFDRLQRKEFMSGGLSGGIVMLLVAVGLTGFLFFRRQQQASNREQLNIFNWTEYMPRTVVEEFSRRTGIKVNYDTYSSNEEMLAKLQAGASGYDLIVASDYYVQILVKRNLIEQLDTRKLHNFGNLESDFVNLAFDPGNKYSVPYLWGTAGIAFNRDKVSPIPRSFDDLMHERFRNRLVVVNDVRAVIGMALRSMGYSMNETDPARVREAGEKLRRFMPLVKTFDSDSPKTLLLNGEADAGIVWGAEATLAHRENPAIDFVMPADGGELYLDNMAIPRGAPHMANALTFIDYILEPEVSLQLSRAYPYGNPNREAKAIMDPQLLNEGATYPPPEDLRRGEWLVDVGEATALYDRIWTEVKGQ
ncbi:MAG: extracellular solute-binding protein [Acidobacteria bacterium]|nr:extracellular solute-binding protein [Acidobacteriota bacterium]